MGYKAGCKMMYPSYISLLIYTWRGCNDTEGGRALTSLLWVSHNLYLDLPKTPALR